ncbi:MAG: hypothetical protein ABI614_08710 [Planctomycetota bacterium]
MAVTDADIQAFVAFARQQAASNVADDTMTELVAKWQAVRERESVDEAIRESLADIEAGRTESFAESQERFRRERSLPPHA